MKTLECIEVPANGRTEKAIIWLHGLGDSGSGWSGITDELKLEDLNIHYLFPNAPSIAVTINGGMLMPAWYDIYEMSLERKIDQGQIEASAQQIHRLIDQLLQQGLRSEDVLLVGFSQGGAVAYQAGISYKHPLAGIAALSTYYATGNTVSRHPSNQNTPILIQHGQEDPVVPMQLALQAQDTLKEQGYINSLQLYPMAHTACEQQINDLALWIRQQFKAAI